MNLLSETTKMPCYGFNLPALSSCPAAKLVMRKKGGEDLVCHRCYALRGMYMFPSARKTLANRFAFVKNSLRKDNGATFVAEMVAQIRDAYFDGKGNLKDSKRTKRGLFRVHDSGDFFSDRYIDCWISIAKALPSITFWAPTREYVRPSQLKALRKLASLPNFIVRPSGLTVNRPVDKVDGLDAGSSVFRTAEQAEGHYVCPSTLHKKDKSNCESCGCFACFTKSARKPVAFLAH